MQYLRIDEVGVRQPPTGHQSSRGLGLITISKEKKEARVPQIMTRLMLYIVCIIYASLSNIVLYLLLSYIHEFMHYLASLPS